MNNSEIEKYIRKGLPENWFDYANELKNAAEELWRLNANKYVVYNTHDEGDYRREIYSRTYFLLLGVAIENLLKGILISENPNDLENGKISKDISSGHNLVFLSEKITSILFTENEIKTFEISDVIPYWGKYPIPKNFSNLIQEVFFDKDCFNKLLNLYSKLETKL